MIKFATVYAPTFEDRGSNAVATVPPFAGTLRSDPRPSHTTALQFECVFHVQLRIRSDDPGRWSTLSRGVLGRLPLRIEKRVLPAVKPAGYVDDPEDRKVV